MSSSPAANAARQGRQSSGSPGGHGVASGFGLVLYALGGFGPFAAGCLGFGPVAAGTAAGAASTLRKRFLRKCTSSASSTSSISRKGQHLDCRMIFRLRMSKASMLEISIFPSDVGFDKQKLFRSCLAISMFPSDFDLV